MRVELSAVQVRARNKWKMHDKTKTQITVDFTALLLSHFEHTCFIAVIQREFYRSLLARHMPVLVTGKSSGGATTHCALKNLVMELRKCCNHPYLFQGAEPTGERGGTRTSSPIHRYLKSSPQNTTTLKRRRNIAGNSVHRGCALPDTGLPGGNSAAVTSLPLSATTGPDAHHCFSSLPQTTGTVLPASLSCCPAAAS